MKNEIKACLVERDGISIEYGARGEVYIYLKPELKNVDGCVAYTKILPGNVFLDLDENDEPIGIEILR